MLELAKALALLACILSLYCAALQAFLIPDGRWEPRLFAVGLYLVFSASVCVFSGLLFSWPSPDNPERGEPLAATLPVRLYLWAAGSIVVFFFASWYLHDLGSQAGPYISDRVGRGF